MPGRDNGMPSGVPRRSRTLRPLLLFSLAALALGALYYFIDPSGSRWMPKCLLHSLTGYDCPGCGAQRMAHALLHGDFRSAWEANPFLLCLLPLIPAGIWADLRPGLLRRITYSPWFIVGLTSLVVAWGIGRNFMR